MTTLADINLLSHSTVAQRRLAERTDARCLELEPRDGEALERVRAVARATQQSLATAALVRLNTR